MPYCAAVVKYFGYILQNLDFSFGLCRLLKNENTDMEKDADHYSKITHSVCVKNLVQFCKSEVFSSSF